ncbi:MAG TPA: hypothetical protein VEZ71_22845, partial [Archangium sp.]|nr:hypothetical protein [Archangium sp.]
ADPLSFTREAVPRYKARTEHPAPVANPTSLKVMAWNVKYGACRIDFWFDFWGTASRCPRPRWRSLA